MEIRPLRGNAPAMISSRSVLPLGIGRAPLTSARGGDTAAVRICVAEGRWADRETPGSRPEFVATIGKP